ncbi:hypothetical protein K402DRAFT_391419 [Aulographum hederae CBS 113979]|uniref:DUF7728 domain-containing protein n=1 Tax=Aulographum hederae CBS 113979 TaxID=1176131 RepID=A0A6G1H651_9PEZI|nr:hypothetical protein K402DRAFT_391419 [Aulographum hederae CBS 113979]
MYAALGVCATLAFGAQAFLLPPDVGMESVKGDGAPSLLAVDPLKQTVTAECQGCKADNIVFNIAVGSDATTLMLNGVQFYPPNLHNEAGPSMPPVTYAPTEESTSSEDLISTQQTSQVTGWAFHAGTSHTTPTGEELLDMAFRVVSIDDAAVLVPRVQMTVIKDNEGRLLIHSAHAETAEETQEAVVRECRRWPVVCRWRQILAAKLSVMRAGIVKGCGGARHRGGRPGHGVLNKIPGFPGVHGGPPRNMHHGPHSFHDGAGKPWMQAHGDEKMDGHHRPHHNGHAHGGRPHAHGHKHHHHMNKLHRVLRKISMFVMAIVVPVAVGIMAGIVTYVVGMVVGCSLAWVWVRFFRGGKKGYSRVAGAEEEAPMGRRSCEKIGLMEAIEEGDEDEEVAAPAYEEKA